MKIFCMMKQLNHYSPIRIQKKSIEYKLTLFFTFDNFNDDIYTLLLTTQIN